MRYRSCDLKLRSCTWGIDPHPIFGPKSIRKSCEVCQYRRIILIQSIGNTNTYKHQFDGTCRCAPNSITFSSQGSPFNVLRIPPNSPPFPPSIPLSTHRGTLTMVSSVVPIKPSATSVALCYHRYHSVWMICIDMRRIKQLYAIIATPTKMEKQIQQNIPSGKLT